MRLLRLLRQLVDWQEEPLLFLFAIAFASALHSSPMLAQTPTVFVSPLAENLASLMQGSDGYYYSVFQGDDLCSQSMLNHCGQIFRSYRFTDPEMSIYTFAPGLFAPGEKNPASGGLPLTLVEGADGALYGTTPTGGANTTDCNPSNTIDPTDTDHGCGFFFKINHDGSDFTVLHNFTAGDGAPSTEGSPNMIQGGSLLLGSDGNFYGTSGAPPASTLYSIQVYDGQFIYKLTPKGNYTLLHNFQPIGGPNLALGVGTSALVEGTDGNFYGTTPGYRVNLPTKTAGTVFRMSPSGTVSTIATFPADNSQGLDPVAGALVEGPDHNFYGMTMGFSDLLTPGGTIFRVTPGGQITTLHTFSAFAGGFYPTESLLFSAGGNLYGTTTTGGQYTSACAPLMGCGTIFTIDMDGTGFKIIYSFGGNYFGEFPGPLMAGSEGAVEGVAGGKFPDAGQVGTIFEFYPGQPTTSSHIPIEIDLRYANSNRLVPQNAFITLGTQIDVQWVVRNGWSETLQNCYGAAALDGPQGKLVGTETAEGYVSQERLDTGPDEPGTYKFSLLCGGVEYGESVTFTLGFPLKIGSNPFGSMAYGQSASATLTATGGPKPYTWSIISGALPPGLKLDTSTGVVSGTPTQWGNFPITVQVTDSTSPADKAVAAFNLTVESTLLAQGVAPLKAVVGSTFTQTLSATGGKTPYTWTLLSGTMPDGINFQPGTATIKPGLYGKATLNAVGTHTLTFQVSDSEGTPAKDAVTLTLTVTPTGLVFAPPILPPASVGVPYNFALIASGGTPPYTWSLSSPLPAGLTLGTTSGVIAGKPLQFISASYTLTLTDSGVPPQKVQVPLSLKVKSTLIVNTTTLPDGVEGIEYAATLLASGGIGPYTWFFVSGDEPPGLLGNPQGKLFGTPTGNGKYNFVLEVQDSEGDPASQQQAYVLTVLKPVPEATTTKLTSSSLLTKVGIPVTFTATVSKQTLVPTGLVSFNNGTNNLGMVELKALGASSAVAQWTTYFTAAGTYKISAGYTGDDLSNASVSNTLVEVISELSTATPTINPAQGFYTTVQSVTMTDANLGAAIYYTTDGSNPTTSSTKYTNPFKISASALIKAIAIDPGRTQSTIAVGNYIVHLPADAAPSFNPPGGTYYSAQSVTLASATAGAVFYYTTDGTTPTAASAKYTTPIHVLHTATIRALCVSTGHLASPVVATTYNIHLPAATPTFTPAPGAYTTIQIVTIADATPGAAIYYSLNNTTPTTLSARYTGPIQVAKSTVLRAIAVTSGYSQSAVATANYVIHLTTATTPTFTPIPGTYYPAQNK